MHKGDTPICAFGMRIFDNRCPSGLSRLSPPSASEVDRFRPNITNLARSPVYTRSVITSGLHHNHRAVRNPFLVRS